MKQENILNDKQNACLELLKKEAQKPIGQNAGMFRVLVRLKLARETSKLNFEITRAGLAFVNGPSKKKTLGIECPKCFVMLERIGGAGQAICKSCDHKWSIHGEKFGGGIKKHSPSLDNLDGNWV